jgi:hypothetical protein
MAPETAETPNLPAPEPREEPPEHWMGPAGERCFRSPIGVAVEITYHDDGRFTFDGVEMVEGFPDHRIQPEWGPDVFEARVVGCDGAKLISFLFGAHLWFYDNPTVLTERPILLIFPRCRDGRGLDILDHEGRRRLRVDLGPFAECEGIEPPAGEPR